MHILVVGKDAMTADLRNWYAATSSVSSLTDACTAAGMAMGQNPNYFSVQVCMNSLWVDVSGKLLSFLGLNEASVSFH